jgi:hypothetical protein
MESPKIDSAELLLKNIELYNTIKSLVFCMDKECAFNDNQDIKILLAELEAGIFSLNNNMCTQSKINDIQNKLRIAYDKVSNARLSYMMFGKTNRQLAVAQPVEQPAIMASKVESPKFPFTASTFQTTINAITSGRIKWSGYNEQRRTDFQNYFKQKYGYDFAPTNDEDAKNILLIRVDKDKTQGGKNKKSKKMRIRKLKKSQRK